MTRTTHVFHFTREHSSRPAAACLFASINPWRRRVLPLKQRDDPCGSSLRIVSSRGAVTNDSEARLVRRWVCSINRLQPELRRRPEPRRQQVPQRVPQPVLPSRSRRPAGSGKVHTDKVRCVSSRDLLCSDSGKAPPGSAYAAIPPAKYTTGQAPQALAHVRRVCFVEKTGRGTVSPSQQPSKGQILLQSGASAPLACFAGKASAVSPSGTAARRLCRAIGSC